MSYYRISEDKSYLTNPEDHKYYHGIHLWPTHRTKVTLGVASDDGTWEKKPLVVDYWRPEWDNQCVVTDYLYDAAIKKAKVEYPNAIGVFIYDFSWDAEIIAEQPNIDDIECSCCLYGGGIYTPDVVLELLVGVAKKDYTWFSLSHTTKAKSYENRDLRYLGEVESNWPGNYYFIITHHWGRCIKLNNIYGYDNDKWDRMMAEKEKNI